ncbi:hypothetical protein M0R45_036810 [Rubus argutus]|uniref:Uncharacterized protein n=1 Tax=Rubus argutus TaxID=59490 RepID=A0AAW1W1R7_RUBAR
MVLAELVGGAALSSFLTFCLIDWLLVKLLAFSADTKPPKGLLKKLKLKLFVGEAGDLLDEINTEALRRQLEREDVLDKALEVTTLMYLTKLSKPSWLTFSRRWKTL